MQARILTLLITCLVASQANAEGKIDCYQVRFMAGQTITIIDEGELETTQQTRADTEFHDLESPDIGSMMLSSL